MRFTHFFFLLYFFVFLNCREEKKQLFKIEGKQIEISDSLATDPEIEAYVKPFRDHIEKDLDSVLAYAADSFSKKDGYLNTAIGNFMADAMYAKAHPVFKSRTGHDIDMAIMNYGGIRATLKKGNVSKRTAFQIMPFENKIVVVALKGTQIERLIAYLCKAKSAHPISKLNLIVDQNFEVLQATIKGQKIQQEKTYYVATSDYLYNGGDNMLFFNQYRWRCKTRYFSGCHKTRKSKYIIT